ncbi:MAG: XRE family transcriptional regulator [Proteobacteria bacterium]|nr:XRE family transcriptional regulator [Pseudomonadota bacterium]
MKELGAKIRFQRKALGHTLKSLADELDISVMTLQRIETGQISPSVALMQKIAQELKKPMSFFVHEREASFVHLAADDLRVYSQGGVELSEVFPQGAVDNRISVFVTRAKDGRIIKPRTTNSRQFIYQISGGLDITHEGKSMSLQPGEAIYFDAAADQTFMAKGDSVSVQVVIRK